MQFRAENRNLYYNANVFNTTDEFIDVSFDDNRSDNIIPISGNYKMSIVRMQLPNSIPIMEFKADYYYITLRYAGIDYQQALVFQSQDTSDLSSRNIETYQHFLTLLNSAFSGAYTALNTATGGTQPPQFPPYVTFNPVDGLFSMWCDRRYDAIYAGSATVEIYMNYHLFQLFDNWNYIYNGTNTASKKDIQIVVSYTGTNTRTVNAVPFYEFIQEVSTVYFWWDFSRIVLTSPSLPVIKECIATQSSEGNNILLPIVADFTAEITDRSSFIYIPQPEFHFYDMVGNLPLRRFSFDIFYVKRDGTYSRYQLPPKSNMSIKFLFQRKGPEE